MSVISPVPTQGPLVAAPTASRGRAARARAVVRQVGLALLTLFLISFIAFVAMNHSPVQIARNVLGRGATPAQLRAYATSHGLDRPVMVQYLSWLGHFVRGDWGATLVNQQVRPLVLPAYVHTGELALITLAWSVLLAIALGVAAARRRGAVDQSLFVGMTVLAALPEFVIGLGLMVTFAVQLRWFPVSSNAVAEGSAGEKLLAFVLPSLTLGLGVVAYVWRITRASMLEALAAPYTRSAILRGLRRRRVIWRHAVRSASVPLVNAIAINIIYLMGGVIVVENVFAFPGLGRLLVQAIAQGDANLALAIIMLLGAVFIVLGLVADVVVTYLDPRLKGGSR
ncbi:ABC transporter permease [Pedococcus sp. 5OH_020]|uniref:ABC transporter permease n=1 Tax=Pedococcus sp. 5OH_020 TaxID=2989814 RepID=UPI0022E99B5B|nr:ABC transporter permease [Pedococcus sp. 5OH_020]